MAVFNGGFKRFLALLLVSHYKRHKDACTPLVGGIGFWARWLLLCRENSPFLWLWVCGGLEPCTPPPSSAALHHCIQPAKPCTVSSVGVVIDSGGSSVHGTSNFTVLGIHRWRSIKAVKYSENWHRPQEQGVECTESHGDGQINGCTGPGKIKGITLRWASRRSFAGSVIQQLTVFSARLRVTVPWTSFAASAAVQCISQSYGYDTLQTSWCLSAFPRNLLPLCLGHFSTFLPVSWLACNTSCRVWRLSFSEQLSVIRIEELLATTAACLHCRQRILPVVLCRGCVMQFTSAHTLSIYTYALCF
jgi:hypothetical protein